jgi:hypothetical protein
LAPTAESASSGNGPPSGTPESQNAESSSQAKDAASGGDASGTSVVVALVTAIGAGISVLGFVAFFGAAVEWVRFDHAHLPGNEAVAVIPRSVLLTNGANFLVPAVLLALAFVAVLYVVEVVGEGLWRVNSQVGEARSNYERNRHKADVLEKIAQQAEGRADAAGRRRAADDAARAAAKAQISLENTTGWDPNPTYLWRRNVRLTLTLALYAVAGVYALHVVGGLESWRAILLSLVIVVANVLYLIVHAHTDSLRQRIIAAAAIGVAALVVVVAGGILVGSSIGSYDRVVAFSVALVGATVVSLAVLAKTKSFVWLALTAFFAVGIVDGLITYYRTVDRPKVEPAALLRADRRPLYGFYVAETSDRVYLGTRGNGTVRMASVPRDEVSDMSVGPLLSQRHAKVRAVNLALGLCKGARAPVVASSEAATPTATPQSKCSEQVVSKLEDRLTKINRRLQVERVYKGTFEGGGTVRFRARIKHREPIAVLGPPRSAHSWRFKNLPIHCGKGHNIAVTNHVPFTMDVIDDKFHATLRIHRHPTAIQGRFFGLKHVTGTIRVNGAVTPYTHCDTGLRNWTAAAE